MLYFFNQRKKDVKRLGGNYEKEIFRHLQETLGKVDRLTEEVTSIKREHQKEIAFLKAENLKLQRENIALKSENAKLKEIAEEYGFYDEFHLSKVFKKYTGISPKDYRLNNISIIP